MTPLMKKLAKKGKSTARRAYDKAESKVMAAVGRKAVKGKVQEVAAVGKKAATAGLVVGAVAAASVVMSEVKKRKKAP